MTRLTDAELDTIADDASIGTYLDGEHTVMLVAEIREHRAALARFADLAPIASGSLDVLEDHSRAAQDAGAFVSLRPNELLQLCDRARGAKLTLDECDALAAAESERNELRVRIEILRSLVLDAADTFEKLDMLRAAQQLRTEASESIK